MGIAVLGKPIGHVNTFKSKQHFTTERHLSVEPRAFWIRTGPHIGSNGFATSTPLMPLIKFIRVDNGATQSEKARTYDPQPGA